MYIVVALSLSLLVILASLFLLAKSKKEDLAKGIYFASYASLSIGILLFLGSIMGGIMHVSHRHCRSNSHIHGHMSQCQSSKSCNKGKCDSAHYNQGCKSMNKCSGKCGGHSGKSECPVWNEKLGHKKYHHKKMDGDKKIEIIEEEIITDEIH